MRTEHKLIEIAREEGVSESRFHAVCSCGWMSGDVGARNAEMVIAAEAKVTQRYHHPAAGRNPTEAESHEANPGVKDWSDKIRREGR